MSIKHIIGGRIINPPERDGAAHWLQIEVLKLRHNIFHITDDTIVRVLMILAQEIEEAGQIVSMNLQVVRSHYRASLTQRACSRRVMKLIDLAV